MSFLPADERATARRRVRQGIKDIAEGRFEDFNAAGLRNLAGAIQAMFASRFAGELVADSLKKLGRRKTA